MEASGFAAKTRRGGGMQRPTRWTGNSTNANMHETSARERRSAKTKDRLDKATPLRLTGRGKKQRYTAHDILWSRPSTTARPCQWTTNSEERSRLDSVRRGANCATDCRTNKLNGTAKPVRVDPQFSVDFTQYHGNAQRKQREGNFKKELSQPCTHTNDRYSERPPSRRKEEDRLRPKQEDKNAVLNRAYPVDTVREAGTILCWRERTASLLHCEKHVSICDTRGT